MLRVNNLDVYYRDLQALRNVSLRVEEGEIISVVGSNGAGKSTLLNTISGLIRSASGRVEFINERIDNLPPYEIAKKGISLIPEGRQLFPFMTVDETLKIGAYMCRDKKKIEENLKWILELFPTLKKRKNVLAGSLSGGEQQMLAIGRGLMSAPKLLMLDEPSLGLMPMLVKEIFDIINLIKERTSILLVEQHVFHALSLANRSYVLENGKIFLEGTGKELLENPQVKRAYLGTA